MTPTSALTVAAWSLVAGRLAVLAVLAARSRRADHAPVRDQARVRDGEWHPRVSSGCGR